MFTRVLIAAFFTASSAMADLATELSVIEQEIAASFSALSRSETETRDAAIQRLISAQDEALEISRAVLRPMIVDQMQMLNTLSVQTDLISKALGGLHSINQAPVPQVLLNPDGALETIQAEILFEALIPDLSDRRAKLITRIEVQSDDVELVLSHYDALAAFIAAVRQERARWNATRTARQPLPAPFEDDAGIQALLQNTLLATDEIQRFLRQRPELNAPLALDRAGTFLVPKNLRAEPELVATGVGDARRTGLRMPLRPFSKIGAPATGTVIAAGELAPNLNIIVIEVDRGLQVYLSGMSEVLVAPDDVVLKGQEIALFGPNMSADNGLSSKSDPDQLGLGENDLYVEVRVNGEPTEPMQWFELEEKEVRE